MKVIQAKIAFFFFLNTHLGSSLTFIFVFHSHVMRGIDSNFLSENFSINLDYKPSLSLLFVHIPPLSLSLSLSLSLPPLLLVR